MNIIKLQQDLLSLVKRDHDICRIHGVVDDKFYLTNEKGTALYIIPERLWYLSEKIFSNPPALAKSIVEEYSNIKADDLPLKDTNTIKTINSGKYKGKYKVLEFGTGEKVYLSMEQAKYLSKDADFYKTRKRGMIKCAEYEKVVAAIGEFIIPGESN